MGRKVSVTTESFNCLEDATVREQSMKVLEEAAELFNASREYERFVKGDAMERLSVSCIDSIFSAYRREMAEELCDVYQALANLVDVAGLSDDEIQDAADYVTEKNRARDRF